MSNQGRQLTYSKVYGPDTHITEIVPLALGVTSGQKSTLQPAKSISASTPPSPPAIDVDMNSAENSASVGEVKSSGERTQAGDNIVHFEGGKADADVPDFVGMGLMSDGDQTKSPSSADFGTFVLEK